MMDMRIFPFLVVASLAFLACESRTASPLVDAESPLASRLGGKTFVTGFGGRCETYRQRSQQK